MKKTNNLINEQTAKWCRDEKKYFFGRQKKQLYGRNMLGIKPPMARSGREGIPSDIKKTNNENGAKNIRPFSIKHNASLKR